MDDIWCDDWKKLWNIHMVIWNSHFNILPKGKCGHWKTVVFVSVDNFPFSQSYISETCDHNDNKKYIPPLKIELRL